MELFITLFYISNMYVIAQKNNKHHSSGIVLHSSLDQELPPDKWFEQKLDHFDLINTRTWLQRYWINDSFFKVASNAPIFLMISGESDANPAWLVEGAWIHYAQKFGALCFQIEHRFYGESRPTPDLSVKNLRYLTIDQALADLAYFIGGMNVKYKLTTRNKWLTFGGSYSGTLSAWVRYKYPHLVHAAVSSSGPLTVVAEFKSFNEVIKKSLATFNNECVTSVHKASQQFDQLIRYQSGGDLVSEKFKLCTKLDISIKEDISRIASQLSDNFVNIVQYDNDNRIIETATENITIDDICKIMTNKSLGDPIDRYAAVNSMTLQLNSEDCLDYKYENNIQNLRNETWRNDESGRQWLFQTCTEIGYYQTSSSPKELFGSNFPLSFFLKQCSDVFGERFNNTLLTLGIQRTNLIYGGLHLSATRILSVHGSLDPWQALGITVTKNPEIPALYIKGVSHCASMYPPSPKDLPQLIEARVQIEVQIEKWLYIDDAN